MRKKKAPFFEEVVFRGFIYGNLRKNGYNDTQYIWLSSILFSFGFFENFWENNFYYLLSYQRMHITSSDFAKRPQISLLC